MKEKFEIERKNALANPNLYGGRYTQKNRKDAYIEFLEDMLRASDARRKLLEDKLKDSESLMNLLEDLQAEVESLIDEMRDRERDSFYSTEHYKELYGRIDEELEKRGGLK